MPNPHFIILDVVPPHTRVMESEDKVEETVDLVHTYTGGTGIVSHIIQQRIRPDPTTYIGKGKVQELFDYLKIHKPHTIVINDLVKPTQIHDLFIALWKANNQTQVWDRADLILKIFHKHAQTAEAKLQIELAAMQHMGPRIYGMGMIMSRQGGGIGTRGIGETNTERMKRHWRDEMKKTKEKLEKLKRDRSMRMQKRKERGVFSVAIVGYTNAGKTTLFNALTGKEKLAKNVLFATLDSATGYITMPHGQHMYKPILISDTIGFIRNLPPKLIEAFRSTLMETVHAELLLHVVDASDPRIEEKIDTVRKTLDELGVGDKPTIMVLNKIDLPPGATKERIQTIIRDYNPLLISARQVGDYIKVTNVIANMFGLQT